MRNLRNFFAAATLMAVLSFGTTFANAGLLISDLSGDTSTTCTDTTSSVTGVLITGFTGVLITGFTGVLITGVADVEVNCGVLITG